MQNNFDIIITKLDSFIRRYYKNRLIRGSLIFLTVFLILFLFIDALEYFAWMGTTGRSILFFLSLVLIIILFVYLVIIPLLKIVKIGKTISYEDAARLIGKYFPEVDDKLLNVIQLKFNEKSFTEEEIELLSASIDQKSLELKSLPFFKAVDFKRNIKYLKYFVPPFLVILILLIVYPAFITEPSVRIVKFNKKFEKPLPYTIKILNKNYNVIQHDDFTVYVKLEGDEIPDEVYVVINGLKYRMYHTSKYKYEYTFSDVNKSFEFSISSGDYVSNKHRLTVLPKPVIYSFDLILKYPKYLNKKSDIINGISDLVVPEGTIVEWRIHTKDVSNVTFVLKDSSYKSKRINQNTFTQKLKAIQDVKYGVIASNDKVRGTDTLFYSIKVIKDKYPEIEVSSYKPDRFNGLVLFNGKIKDDYGFHSLSFFAKKSTEKNFKNIEQLKINKDVTEQYFNYTVNLEDLGLKRSEKLNYFFEVKDNDAIHNFKAARTSVKVLEIPSESELEKVSDSTFDRLKEQIKEKLNQIEKLNRDLQKLKLDIYDKKNTSWNERKKIEKIFQKEIELQKKLDELKELSDSLKNLEKSLNNKIDSEQMNKLDELSNLMNNLKDKDLLKELEKLKDDISKLDKDKLQKTLNKIDNNNKTLQKDLERNLELFKQFEVEQGVKKIVDQMKKLADKQSQLADSTGKRKISKEKALKEQKDINKKLKELEDELDKMIEKDQELESPLNIRKDTTLEKQIKKDLNDASNSLEKKKMSKASEKQKSAASKMKQMADNLDNLLMQAMSERQGEDMEKIKRLLDNVVDLSFKMEDKIEIIGSLSTNDPKYISETKNIQKIKEEFKTISDSLNAIGKRQFAIKPYIQKETSGVNNKLRSAIENMTSRRRGNALSDLQYSMMHINNLALMLEESLEQMKNSMNMNGKGGSKSCPKPGKGKSMEELMKMQQQLSESLSKQGKKGKGKGKDKNKSGKNQSKGQWGNPEELAKMAAMQYQIRMELQKLMEGLNTGNGKEDLKKAIEEMKKNENDIINKRITRETINRQKDIQVRLLKAKNAKLQRDKEKRRESKEGHDRKNRRVVGKDFVINKIDKKDIILTDPIKLNDYYKTKFNKYLFNLEKEK